MNQRPAPHQNLMTCADLTLHLDDRDRELTKARKHDDGHPGPPSDLQLPVGNDGLIPPKYCYARSMTLPHAMPSCAGGGRPRPVRCDVVPVRPWDETAVRRSKEKEMRRGVAKPDAEYPRAMGTYEVWTHSKKKGRVGDADTLSTVVHAGAAAGPFTPNRVRR